MRCAVTLTALWLAALPAQAGGDARDRVVFGSDHNYPPYEYLDGDGKPRGFNVDLIRAIGAVTGLDVEVRLGPWAQIRHALEQTHTVDVADMFYSPVRARSVDFAEPFAIVHDEIFVRRDDPRPCEFTRLAGRNVLVQRASYTEDYLVRRVPDAIRVPVDAEPDALRLLAAGSYDCAIVSQVTGRHALRTLGLDRVVSYGKPVLPRDYGFVVAKGNRALLQRLNLGLSRVRASGQYSAIYDRWFGDLEPKPVWLEYARRYAAWMAAVAGGLLLLGMAGVWILRRRVAVATAGLRRELAERQLAEQARRASEERLLMALEAARMGTWDWDIASGEVRWSDHVEALFGLPAGSFSGNYQAYRDCLYPDDVAQVEAAIEAALAGSDEYHVEHRIRRPDGGIRWLAGRGRVRRDAAGQPVGMAGTVMDITDRKLAEREREQLLHELSRRNAEMESFVYTISHDLKAPVITIDGFASYLGKDLAGGDLENARDAVTEIRKAAAQMRDLIDDLLVLSRSGRLVGDPAPVALADLLADVIAALRPQLSAQGATITIAPGLPVVNVDRRRFGQVFSNLIDNAVKYRDPQRAPVIEIGGQPDGNAWRVHVRDNGIGIKPEYHERIFGLFQRLDSGAEGTGVGLTIARRVVEAYGGRLWVESQPGAGSSFWILLPASTIVPPRPPGPSHPENSPDYMDIPGAQA